MNARETMNALMTGKTVKATGYKADGRMYMLDPEGRLLVLTEYGEIKTCESIDLSMPYEVVENEADALTIVSALLAGSPVKHKDLRYWLDGDLLRKQWKGERPITLADFSKEWEVLPEDEDEEEEKDD